MERKSAPRTRTRVAMEFSSFRKAMGMETTINVTMREACRRLTPLSRSYKARATKIKPAMPMKPGIEKSTYSKPANLPGFLVELMLSSLVVRGLVKGSTGETPKAVEMFRRTQFRKLLLYPSELQPHATTLP